MVQDHQRPGPLPSLHRQLPPPLVPPEHHGLLPGHPPGHDPPALHPENGRSPCRDEKPLHRSGFKSSGVKSSIPRRSRGPRQPPLLPLPPAPRRLLPVLPHRGPHLAPQTGKTPGDPLLPVLYRHGRRLPLQGDRRREKTGPLPESPLPDLPGPLPVFLRPLLQTHPGLHQTGYKLPGRLAPPRALHRPELPLHPLPPLQRRHPDSQDLRILPVWIRRQDQLFHLHHPRGIHDLLPPGERPPQLRRRLPVGPGDLPPRLLPD